MFGFFPDFLGFLFYLSYCLPFLTIKLHLIFQCEKSFVQFFMGKFILLWPKHNRWYMDFFTCICFWQKEFWKIDFDTYVMLRILLVGILECFFKVVYIVKNGPIMWWFLVIATLIRILWWATPYQSNSCLAMPRFMQYRTNGHLRLILVSDNTQRRS